MDELVARWESRSGKHWVELYLNASGFRYVAPGCGGYLTAAIYKEAIKEMQEKVDSGYFLPDAARSPMKRVS